MDTNDTPPPGPEAEAPADAGAEPPPRRLLWAPETGGLADPDHGPLGLEGDLEDQIVSYARLVFGPPCPVMLRLQEINACGTRTYTATGRGEITISVEGVDNPWSD